MGDHHDIQGGARIYLRPAGFLYGEAAQAAVAAGSAYGLAGGTSAFSHLEVIETGAGGTSVSQWLAAQNWGQWLASLDNSRRSQAQAVFDRLQAPRPGLGALAGAGRENKSALIMGILNVTPDSFSDGGHYFNRQAAIEQGIRLAEAGADILDIGGESTRPGAQPVSEAEEIDRVLPVIEGLVKLGVALSIDTRHAGVMAAAVKAGARIINDVSALTADRQSLDVAQGLDAFVVLMHAKGDPQTMQIDPDYGNVLWEVYDYLESRIKACVAAGIVQDRLVVDPGIGFGKNLEHNLALLSGLALFHGLGVPVLLGVSRKGFIGRLTGETTPAARLPGSLAAQLQAMAMGVQIVRVHDVAEMVQARKVTETILNNH
jgi:dihydropteroate synthase